MDPAWSMGAMNKLPRSNVNVKTNELSVFMDVNLKWFMALFSPNKMIGKPYFFTEIIVAYIE